MMKVKKSRAGKLHGRKHVRWAHGHSSDSNPKIGRHRKTVRHLLHTGGSDEAHIPSTQPLIPPLSAMEGLSIGDDNADKLSVAESQESALTVFTSCTNGTFGRLHRSFKPDSSLHHDTLAVLAALAELIKSEGGNETETEYFAAILTSLVESQTAGQLNIMAACAYLLHLVMRKVPEAVVRNRCGQVTQILFEALSFAVSNSETETRGSNTTSLIRYLVTCLGMTLKYLPGENWQDSSNQRIFQTLLMVAISNEAPKVRKAAEKSVIKIMEQAVSAASILANICSKQCNSVLEAHSTAGAGQETLYVLSILHFVLSKFSESALKRTCETIFRVLTLSQSLVSVVAFRALYGLFLYRPSIKNLPGKLNAQLIEALYDFKPAVQDAKLMTSWMQVQSEAHVCLCERDRSLGVVYLPKFMQCCAQMLTAPLTHGDSLKVIGDFVVRTVEMSFCEFVTNDSADDVTDSDTIVRVHPEKAAECLNASMDAFASYVNMKHLDRWNVLLPILQTAFASLGRKAADLDVCSRLLSTLAQFRDDPEAAYHREIDSCIGTAVKLAGPEYVLEIISLNLNPEAEVISPNWERSWLLPLLRHSIKQAKLSYFHDNLMPLAMKLSTRVKALTIMDRKGEAKFVRIIEYQVWELLASFCRCPSDLVSALDAELAKKIGDLLTTRPDIKLILLQSIRNLIVFEMKSGHSVETDQPTGMRRYAKNFLPILFALYTVDQDKTILSALPCVEPYDVRGTKLSVLETIRLYVPLAGHSLLTQFTGIALDKIEKNSSSETTVLEVMDIVVSMTSYLSSENLKKILDLITPFISENSAPAVAKKALRVVEQLLSSEQEECVSFVVVHVDQIESLVQNNLTSISGAARASRLHCLCILLNPDTTPLGDPIRFADSVIHDVVLCLKENNVKTRRLAAKCFLTMVKLYTARKFDGAINDALRYMLLEKLWSFMMAQGTKGAQAILVAARLVVYELKTELSSALIGQLLGKVIPCLTVATDERTTVEAALMFLKTFAGACPSVTLAQYLENMVPPLFGLGHERQMHFRFLVRRILVKIVKKLSPEAVRPYIPSAYERQFRNVRKALYRSQRNSGLVESDSTKPASKSVISAMSKYTAGYTVASSKAETIADLLRDSDDESDIADDVSDRKSSKSKKSKRSVPNVPVWLQDDFGDDVTNLLDPASFKGRLTTSNPKEIRYKERKARPMPDNLRFDDDGRLIVDATSSENVTEFNDTMSVDSDNEIMIGRKRRRPGQSEVELKKNKNSKYNEDDDKNEGPSSHSSYKPGGKGIHRNLKESGSQYKSEKARGDVKKKGQKLDPYAYIPLNAQSLNRRKKTKHSGQFKHLLEGARNGAIKGKKRSMKK